MFTRTTVILLMLSLAACSVFKEWARITTLPNPIQPTLVLQVNYEAFTGDAQPGPLPGQTVTVTAISGKRLVCTFREQKNWRLEGPGTCVDAEGRRYEMILERVLNPV